MNAIAFITPGPTEWLLILAIVLVLFGAKKIPELARGLGQGLNEFRKAREELDRSLQRTEHPVPLPHPPTNSTPGAFSTYGGAGCPELTSGADLGKGHLDPTSAAAMDGGQTGKGNPPAAESAEG
jgi:sec-independent protein translocase protein TatA